MRWEAFTSVQNMDFNNSLFIWKELHKEDEQNFEHLLLENTPKNKQHIAYLFSANPITENIIKSNSKNFRHSEVYKNKTDKSNTTANECNLLQFKIGKNISDKIMF